MADPRKNDRALRDLKNAVHHVNRAAVENALKRLTTESFENIAIEQGVATIEFSKQTKNRQVELVADRLIAGPTAKTTPPAVPPAIKSTALTHEFMAMARMVKALVTVDLDEVLAVMRFLPTVYRQHVCETLGIEGCRDMNDAAMIDAVVNWAKNQHTLFTETKKLQQEVRDIRRDLDETVKVREQLGKAYRRSLVSKESTIDVLTTTLALIYETKE